MHGVSVSLQNVNTILAKKKRSAWKINYFGRNFSYFYDLFKSSLLILSSHTCSWLSHLAIIWTEKPI